MDGHLKMATDKNRANFSEALNFNTELIEEWTQQAVSEVKDKGRDLMELYEGMDAILLQMPPERLRFLLCTVLLDRVLKEATKMETNDAFPYSD